jgi:hypothetical protein
MALAGEDEPLRLNSIMNRPLYGNGRASRIARATL